jgi:hypothetical protein
MPAVDRGRRRLGAGAGVGKTRPRHSYPETCMPRESPPRPTLRRRDRHSSFRTINPDPPELPLERTTPVAAEAPEPAQVLRVTPVVLDAVERQLLIEQAAYFRAERRGFAPGLDVADWLEAEREFDRRSPGTPQ